MPTATAPADALPAATRRPDSGFPQAKVFKDDHSCLWKSWERVDAGSVVVFRGAIGVLVAFSAGRFLAKGWVESL